MNAMEKRRAEKFVEEWRNTHRYVLSSPPVEPPPGLLEALAELNRVHTALDDAAFDAGFTLSEPRYPERHWKIQIAAERNAEDKARRESEAKRQKALNDEITAFIASIWSGDVENFAQVQNKLEELEQLRLAAPD